MAFEQTIKFYPKEMGTQKGWCLKNCRIGFRIYTPKYASAKKAMEAGKRNGTFHAGMPPTNIQVPVYTTSPSKNGHVVVSDYGTYYTDGKRYTPSAGSILGWDEMMDGTRVVKTSSGKSFLPAKGYWAKYDVDERVGKLASWMRRNYPAYTKAKALGNQYGNYLSKSMAQFQRNTGLYPDGMTGRLTYNELKKRGFPY
jgi:hypothetical protein